MRKTKSRAGRRPVQSSQLDAIDEGLIKALRQDGRTQNKVLARSLGVSETTLAYRLRRLSDNGVARLTAQQDFAAIGFPILTLVQIWARGREVAKVGQAVARLTYTIGVAAALGHCDIEASVIARDHRDLARALDEIGAIVGVEKIEAILVLDIVKFNADSAAFSS